MRKILTYIILILLSLFYSCEFDSNETFERKISKATNLPIVKLIYPFNDTLILINDTTISFNYECSTKILGYNFYIDNSTKIKSFELLKSGLFEMVSDGYHTLRIEVIVSSGSRSISDIVGAEGYIATWIWKVYIHRNFNNNIESTYNGKSLLIKWRYILQYAG